ncbi:MAG: hypothetical protein COB25_007255 [Oceanospirillales bacterium]|nr:hypothetical protein [Oceanospirillales bacterium]MBL1272231.1 hypothetical protein [Oceanospirillales bacterium]
MKQFGVGCLHFSIGDELKKNITVEEYTDEIVNSLEKLTTVSNINLSLNEDNNSVEICIDEKTKMQNGQLCFPLLRNFNLTFYLYIPKRVQASSIDESEEFIDTQTEIFKVNFVHSWHGPITFIECIDADPNSSPSSAVRIVREYLIKEFSSLDTYLFLDFMGPSPFHANFSLSDNEEPIEGENAFTLEHNKLRGYDRLNFKYFNPKIKSEDQALDYLYHSLSDELSFYYYLKVNRSSEIHDWSSIQELVHSLLEFEDESNKKSVKEKFFLKPKLFKKAFKETGLFKGEVMYNKSIIDREFKDIYFSEKQSVYLRHFIEKVITEWQVYPVQETIDLLMYFDQKNSKSLELSIIFTAAVVGGAIGGTISVLFS